MCRICASYTHSLAHSLTHFSPHLTIVGYRPVLNSRRPDVRLSRDWQAAAAAPGGETRPVIENGVLPADEALTRGSCDFLTGAGGISVDGGAASCASSHIPACTPFSMHTLHAHLSIHTFRRRPRGDLRQPLAARLLDAPLLQPHERAPVSAFFRKGAVLHAS